MSSSQNPQLSMEEGMSQLSFLPNVGPVSPDASELHEDIKKKKKKKQKKKKMNNALSVLVSSPLPSQNCVEARFPFKIIVKHQRGRCAIATRDIKAGELIISEQALAFVFLSTYQTTACHACCKGLSEASPRTLCPECNYTLFCEECRKTNLKLHSQCCPVLRTIVDIAKETDCDADLLRLAFFLSLQRSSSFSQSSQALCDGLAGKIEGDVLHPSFQDAMALQTHQDKLPASWKLSVKKGCQMLLDQAANHFTNFEISAEEMEFLAALINANAHGMGAQGLHNTDIAIGIFPFVSMLNHSCRPNCCFFSEKNVMHVRATREISKNTELCLSYINLYEARSTRRDQLAATKHFYCACTRCIEPLSSSVDRFLEGVLCSVRGCGGVIVKKPQEQADQHMQPWQCDTCSGVYDPALKPFPTRPLAERPWDLLKLAQDKLTTAISVYKQRHFRDARIMLEDFLSEFTGKLHPLHVLLFDALTPLMNCCRVLGDAEAGAKVCRNIINSLEKILNGPSLELANFYVCLGEMLSQCADSADLSPILAKRYKKQAQEAFNQVRHLRTVCMGRAN